jgi:diguanylate cyclase (GGDEF)-like protein/PAS domain S-box-containing protein
MAVSAIMSSFESSTVELGQERSPRFERLLTSISHHFLRLEANHLEVGIVGALRSICEATGADRGALLEIASNGSRKIASAHTYSEDEVSWSPNGIKGQSIEQMGWLADRLVRREIVHISSSEEFPASAGPEREFYEAQRLKSVICVPLISDGELQAITCFGATEQKPNWRPTHVAFFHGATEILGSAIHRLRTELELAASREWLELAHRAGHSTAWEWVPDDDSLTFSSTTAEVFGVPADHLPRTGKELLEFIPKADHHQILRTFKRVFSTGEAYEVEHRFDVPGRGTVWALVRGLVQKDSAGHVVKVVGVSADITERKHAEQALQRAKEHAQVTLSSISDGVVRTDAAGRIDFLNPSAERLLGITLPQVQGQMLSRFYRSIAGDARNPKPNVVEQCLSSRHVMEPAEASLLVLEDGSELAVRESAAPIIAENGDLVGAVLVFTNVTQLRSLQRRMEHLASHDPLTGLINRREFELRLAEAITDAANSLRQHILCYLDLDEFKVVNDTCGHGAGDELLRQLTSVLSAVIPKGNTLARLGGDEFGILFMNCDPDEATEHAQTMIDAVRQYRFQWEGQIFEVAASIGIVPIVGGNGNLAELLSAADSACYVAKDRGRNQIHVTRVDDSAVRVRHTEMRWVERINRALHENRFRLFKQPIRPLQNLEAPQYHELLLRLVDVEGRIVAPSQFITAAERYRMMPVIDLWVVGAALNTIGTIDSADDISAAFTINLSGQSFGNAELKMLILEQLDRLEIPPRRVMFEITETAAISNLAQALEFMNSLRERGCRFVLDDFGSGLSSFRYLKSLDIEFLKIDGELVRAIARDPIQREMVAAIHRIGESMGIQTIGEWVENSEIEKALTDIGVDYAQGWGVGRPEPFVE